MNRFSTAFTIVAVCVVGLQHSLEEVKTDVISQEEHINDPQTGFETLVQITSNISLPNQNVGLLSTEAIQEKTPEILAEITSNSSVTDQQVGLLSTAAPKDIHSLMESTAQIPKNASDAVVEKLDQNVALLSTAAKEVAEQPTPTAEDAAPRDVHALIESAAQMSTNASTGIASEQNAAVEKSTEQLAQHAKTPLINLGSLYTAGMMEGPWSLRNKKSVESAFNVNSKATDAAPASNGAQEMKAKTTAKSTTKKSHEARSSTTRKGQERQSDVAFVKHKLATSSAAGKVETSMISVINKAIEADEFQATWESLDVRNVGRYLSSAAEKVIDSMNLDTIRYVVMHCVGLILVWLVFVCVDRFFTASEEHPVVNKGGSPLATFDPLLGGMDKSLSKGQHKCSGSALVSEDDTLAKKPAAGRKST